MDLPPSSDTAAVTGYAACHTNCRPEANEKASIGLKFGDAYRNGSPPPRWPQCSRT
jgi:hypothetical protein